MKNPTVATLLNIIPGLGYLYLGRRRIFAALLLTVIVLSVISSFDPMLSEYYNSDYRIWDWLSLIALLITEAAFMLDAYQEAVRLNSKK